MDASKNQGTVTAPTDLRDRARERVLTIGVRRAAVEFGMNPTALAAAIAGLGIRRGTLAQLVAALEPKPAA